MEADLMGLTREEVELSARKLPGDVVVYLLDGGLYRLYASEGIPALTGYTAEEFKAFANKDALLAVVEPDRQMILDEIERGKDAGRDFDVTYRVFNHEQGFIWIHGKGRIIGEMDGKPIVVCTLVNASRENAQQDALVEKSSRPIYVIDYQTFEILYMNNACKTLYGSESRFGQTCHDFKYGFEKPCSWCPVVNMTGETETVDELYVR